MTIPMVATTGVRQTVNANISSAQTTWNLRSALNVAALNCQEPEYTGLVDNYGAFLKRNAKQLSTTNRALTSEFRERYGATYRDQQDTYMTQVYNYFALPPAKNEFCDVSFAISNEALQVVPADLETFAATALPRIEGVFEDFFRSYEQYRVNLQAWNSQYGPPAVTTTAQGYTNATDTTVGLGTTVGSSAPITESSAPSAAQTAIDMEPTTSQTPVVIATGDTAPNGEPVVTLPTEGPIFQSGEVVQGEQSEPTMTIDDTPDPQN
jgi:hypothetical protein